MLYEVITRFPLHFTGIVADRDDFFRVFVERDDGGLAEHHAFALHPDQGVGGAEIDCQVVAEKTSYNFV